MSRTLLPLAGFQVITIGQFWVIAEDELTIDWDQIPASHLFLRNRSKLAVLTWVAASVHEELKWTLQSRLRGALISSVKISSLYAFSIA